MWIKLPNQEKIVKHLIVNALILQNFFDSQMNFVSYNQADSVSFGL